MSNQNVVISLIKNYCINASEDASSTLDDGGLTDGSEKIYEGRYELAEQIIEYINTLEAL
jgi:hypothetical protein